MFTFSTWLLILVILSNLGLGVFVLRTKLPNRVGSYFALFSLSVCAWLITNSLADHSNSSSSATSLSKLTMAAGIAIPWSLNLFSSVFPTKLKVSKVKLALYHVPAVITALLSIFTPLVIKHAVSTDGVTQVDFGPLAAFYLVIFFYYAALSFYHFFLSLKRAHGASRSQVIYLLTGLVISILFGSITNLILPLVFSDFSLSVFGYLSTTSLLGFTAYSIVAHHLFDIRLAIKRTVIFTGLVAFSFVIYTAVIVLISRVFQQQTAGWQSYLVNLTAALAIGFSFEPLRNWLSERTDKWLFKKEYEQQVVISDLSKKLNDVIALDEALEIVMQTIVKVLHLKHAVTYVFQAGEQGTFGVKRVKQIGYSSTARLILEDKDFTISYFGEHSTTTIVQEMELEIEREKELIKKKQDGTFVRQHAIKQAVLKKLQALEIAVAIPLQLNNQPIGLILLSDKLNGEVYHRQDLALLDVVGEQAISSIQKAKLYEGDQMKSEFVSIASHELLTPISAMEGYLSMILDENIGKVDPQARDYLTKVYTSAKRLSLLIKDLLSVSRIESGKMKIDLQQLDMDKMITDTIDQLRFIAQNKGLTVQYEAPKTPYPPVWADPDRTMQVLVNLVSNGIKYTPKGNVCIKVNVDKHSGMLETQISDSGIGMSKAQMSHLFTRFYRIDTPETSGIGGTGLGLYITKSIVEKMGGAITVKSTAGKGSTFSFTLPLFKVETSTLT